VNAGAGNALHVPGAEVSSWPTLIVPLIVGSELFEGARGGGTTTAVSTLVAALAPDALVPVTTTRIVPPTSPLTRV
jgi:hypothetical protein